MSGPLSTPFAFTRNDLLSAPGSTDLASNLMAFSAPQAGAGLDGVGISRAGPTLGSNMNMGLGTGFGWNIGTGQLALAGLGALGNLWSSFQANDLARKQFDFTRSVTNTNLNNQIKSYNTALEDRARARGVVEGQAPEQVQGYIDRNRLAR